MEQWKSIVYLGIVASGLGFFLWNKGATKVNPGTLAAFNNAVVPLAVISSLFVFGEIESLVINDLLRIILGGSLILGAVVISKPLTQSVD
jgi:drug/metabolite transporter (DMT)-like permease